MYVHALAGQTVNSSVSVVQNGSMDIRVSVYAPDSSYVANPGRTAGLSFAIRAPISGTYTFRFDNTYSSMTAKTVNFQYCVQ